MPILYNNQPIKLIDHEPNYGTSPAYPDEIGVPADDIGSFDIQGSTIAQLRLTELDQADPAGRFRLIATGDTVEMQRRSLANSWASPTTMAVWTAGGGFAIPDNQAFNIGTTSAQYYKSTSTLANTVVAGVLIGTPVTPALAADTFILSNLIASGDILLATQVGGNSQAAIFVDGSAGTVSLYGAGVQQAQVSATAFALGVAGTTLGVLTLAGNTSGVVTIQPAAAAGTYTLTLPVNDGGANEFLQTNGSGVLTWAAGSSTWNGIAAPTGNQTLAMGATTTTWTWTAGTANVFRISDGTATPLTLDLRNTTDNIITWAFTAPAQTIAGAAGTDYRTVNIAGITITTSTQTTITTMPGIGLTSFSPAIDQSGGAVTVTKASTVAIRNGGPRPAASVTITTSVALEIADNPAPAGTITNSAGIEVAAMTRGGSLNASIVSLGAIAVGAFAAANYIDDASNGAGSTQLFIGNAAITVASDERVKTNVRPYMGNASASLRSLPVKQWDRYIEGAPFGGYEGGYVGFTAQDMVQVAPWSVNRQGNTGLPWQARYEFLNGLIVKGWQEHDSEIVTLKKRVVKLEQVIRDNGLEEKVTA